MFAVVLTGVFSVSVCSEESENIPYSYVLMEGTTSTLLYADNGNSPFIPFHSAKLMTLLLLCEAMERGELTEDSIITVSSHANSMQGAQIWLDTGEKIPLRELILAITVGNANDACVAIAEAVGGTEDAFVKAMNQKAEELGMSQTFYADSTGVGDGSITTACDLAILASALSNYSWLKEYMTTWMTDVRGGKAQLVSQNRLIRTYGSLTGMKAYYHKQCGNCLIASSERDGLRIICVILGEPDELQRFYTAKEKMNVGYLAYSMYVPRRKDVFLDPARISGGVEKTVETEAGDPGRFIVRTSQLENVKITCEYFEDIQAPISAGDKVGRIVYSVDNEEVYSVDIVAKNDVKKMNVFYGILKLFKSVFAE